MVMVYLYFMLNGYLKMFFRRGCLIEFGVEFDFECVEFLDVCFVSYEIVLDSMK